MCPEGYTVSNCLLVADCLRVRVRKGKEEQWSQVKLRVDRSRVWEVMTKIFADLVGIATAVASLSG